MEINNPILPPKVGYVETIDENGNHVYQPTPETKARQRKEIELEMFMGSIYRSISTLIGATSSENAPQVAAEFHRAVQLFAMSITDEAKMLEIASIYPEYQVAVNYKIGDIFRYGKNSFGDPQLYQVLQDHTSAEEWTPDTAVSLYKAIGITEEGIPEWSQPLGSTDAYKIGDVVMYKGQKYKSTVDANVWAPDVYGWELVDE